jgi:putative ABC transport system permease protein
MLRNLLMVAFRNIKRDKWYSLLNILGLTIGITFSLLLIFYIKDELSFDRYNEKADRIFRVVSYIKEPSKDTMKWVATQYVLAPVLKKDFPDVEEAVRFVNNGKTMFKNGTQRFYNEKTYFADSNVFKIFTYPFIEGNPTTALVDPGALVLTASVAEKYFGHTTGNIGRTLLDDTGGVHKVTAVIADIPKNSHFIFTILMSTTSLPIKFDGGGWGNFNHFTYVLLKPHVDALTFEKKLAPMYDKYMAAIFKQFNIKIRYKVQPLIDIHLRSEVDGEPEDKGSMSYIYIFGAVALFMLLIACINYMNLTTARSARRAKEIGIRKVTGSSKGQLVAQFLVESTLSALFALIISMGIIALLLPTFNTLAGKFISFGSLLEPGTFLILLAIIVFVGFVGGSYPAFYLSKFNPVSVLKGSLSKGSSNVNLRRILIVVQFTIAMTMLICTLIVYHQLQYLHSKDMGFNKDQVLTLPVNANGNVRGKILAFVNEMHSNPDVLSVSASEAAPGDGVSFNLFTVQTATGTTDKGVSCYGVDEDFFKTLGIQLIKGRNFSAPADTLRSIVVNDNMVKYFGWGDNPIGKRVKFPGDTSGRFLEVVGVVKDFNQQSLYSPITPLILFYRPHSNDLILKISGQRVSSTLANIQRTWKTYFPDLPFEYTFLDAQFNSQYAADQKRGKIFTVFSVLTILITCLGLLGLISFTTQQRQKEISIRKILGAGMTEIIPLLTRNFVLLVGLSCFIAFPIAYWFMHQWLLHFSYNTGISITPFLLSALTVLLLTLLTVLFHTVKAAMADPAKGLRTE